MKTSALLFASLVCIGLAGCERHENQAARLGAREAVHAERGERGERGERRGGGIRRACEADIEQFCAADQRGRDRRECLESHKDKLSQACKTAIEERKNWRRDHPNGGAGSDNDDATGSGNGATNNGGNPKP
jgi:hypothetical protein